MASTLPSVDDEPQNVGLFSEVEGDPPPSSDVVTLASRLVEVDFEQFAEVTKSPVVAKNLATVEPLAPKKLVLNLFDDVEFTGIVEHVEPTASGHALWGKLDGVELGTMTLVVNGKVVVGTVRTLNGVYTIRTAGDGTYVIRQIDESSLPPPAEPLEGPLSRRDHHLLREPLGGPLLPRDAGAEADDNPLDDGSEIDVMVVYTPLAKQREGGRAAIEALIDLLVTETNQAYVNSGVIHRIKLVLSEEVDYTEDGDYDIDLRRLQRNSDGYMDHLHELRDLYAADLVHLVVGVRYPAACGVAPAVGGGELRGFALTPFHCGALAFAHELGHNMGLHHDRYVVGNPGRWANYGYVNQRAFEPDAPESSRWHTIMAYSDQCSDAGFSCQWLPYFSNPEKTYNGDPMGVPADYPSTGVDGPADAAGSLNERREITANFRRSSASPTPRLHLTLSPYWLSEDGGVSTVTATLHRPSSEDTTVTVSASQSNTVTLSESRTLTIPAGRMVSDDSVAITGVDNVDQTGDLTVEVSATAENPSGLGVIAPAPIELAIADDETMPAVTLSLSRTEIIRGEESVDLKRTFVTATLDNRSGADTTVTLSATPADVVDVRWPHTLTIPAGQRASVGYGVGIYALDHVELTEAEKMVTVSGTAINSQGVTGPESVTLTVIDDEAPFFADDSIAYTFTEGVGASRVLPEAAYGNGTVTYSLSPAPSNGVTFIPGPPAQIEVSSTAIAGVETSYTLTATDADGDTDTMAVSITIRKSVCLNSVAVSEHADPGIVADCEALMSSRDTLGGNIALNWHENLSIDEWQGVELADGRVVGIDMSHLGLTGTIAGELGNLVKLQRLDLTSNQLTGMIPEELGNLSALESMNLQFNELTGEIPKELGNIANLEELWLRVNQLDEGIPVELGNLSNLRELELSENQLTGKIPKELGNLANLESLGIHSNQLTAEIPAELGNLANLRSLILSGNELTGEIPTEFRNLSNLRNLWLTHNELTGNIPKELGNLFNLEQLLLGYNQLTGEIPTELANLSRLEALWLGHNQLTGSIPPELENLPNLRSLNLSGSQLAGCVPDGLRDVPRNDFALLNLPFCSELACVNRGAVPDETNEGLVSDCGALLAERDVLAGTATLNWSADTPITDWNGVVVDGTPGRVTELHLSSLGLTGEIPIELVNLSNLQHLNLSGNQLTGAIPTELGHLPNLQYLNLSENQLTGTIPTELGNLSSLQSLYLGKNRLTLCVPDELRNVPNNDLASLGLPSCSEHPCVRGGAVTDATNSGLISDCVILLAMQDTWARTATLNWSADKPIEDWSGVHVRGLPERVTSLYLGDRGLTGEIPTELVRLTKLWVLNLSNNQLTGKIPIELVGLTRLGLLILSSNQLDGEIPKELGSISNLQRLNLSGNQFTGAIPPELGNLTNLRTLALDGNQLTGKIPPELDNLYKLETLRLSGNRLTGCIPAGLRDVPGNDLDLLGLPLCPLSPPEALTVSFVTSESNSLTISWAPPSSDGGSDITAYDLRHIETSADETVDLNWVVVEDVWTTGGGALEYTLTGLTADVQYDIQVRAVNATGESPWSETVTGTPTSSICATGGAVPDASNTGLISDCEALLEARDTLAGTATLNWSDRTPIAQWDGISVRGNPGRVTWLNIRGGGLGGSLLAELGRLSSLTYLNLRDNGLTGSIPTELGDLTNLRYLGLNNNELTGPVPDLSGMTRLEQLYLSNNDLTGVLPDWMGRLTKLRELWLWGNELEGPIPDLSGMTGLVRIKLQSNNFTGGIPTWFGEMTDLVYLYLHENRLTGEIPSELGDMSSLRYLWLHTNELEGGIPSELGKLSNLWDLNLHGNNLTGDIPAELGDMTNLTHLRLHRNMLTGKIPDELGDLESLRFMWLHGNMLSGSIPTELGNLEKLERLWLSENSLTGAIPDELGGLSEHSLIQWRLAGNELIDCVPTGMAGVKDNDFDSLGLEVCADS